MSPDESVVRHLRELAREPRFAGSVAEESARAWCRGILADRGFSVTEEPFEFSEAIGRWMVPALATVVATALGLTGLWWRAGGTPRVSALPLGVLALAVTWAAVAATRRWVLTFPVARRRSTNLVATRGDARLWLVAHLDTKSQPMPTLVRATFIIVVVVAFVATLAIAILWPETRIAPWSVPLVGTIGGLVLSLAMVGNASPGALDNATGVAAILSVVERLPAHVSLGVLFTSAEELGLAGARAWVRGRVPSRAINLDTLDDDGVIHCMVHGSRSDALAREVSAASTAADTGPVRVSPLLPGLLTDGVALAAARWECVTVSRGTARTLGRIHRPGDSVERVTGEGASGAARLLLHLLTTGT